MSRAAPKAAYQRETTGAGEGHSARCCAARAGRRGARASQRARRQAGLVFFSAPFDEGSADLLERSGSGVQGPVRRDHESAAAPPRGAKRRPIILSTGMSTLDEVERAVAAIREAGDPALALLHCLSAYPAPVAEVNLRAMDTLRERFGCPVGFSDHTLGIEIALAAVARGARSSRSTSRSTRRLPGPDHRASLDPGEFAELGAGDARPWKSALGDGVKRAMPSEVDTRRGGAQEPGGGPRHPRRRGPDAGRRRHQAAGHGHRARRSGPGAGACACGGTVAADEVIAWEALERAMTRGPPIRRRGLGEPLRLRPSPAGARGDRGGAATSLSAST